LLEEAMMSVSFDTVSNVYSCNDRSISQGLERLILRTIEDLSDSRLVRYRRRALVFTARGSNPTTAFAMMTWRQEGGAGWIPGRVDASSTRMSIVTPRWRRLSTHKRGRDKCSDAAGKNDVRLVERSTKYHRTPRSEPLIPSPCRQFQSRSPCW
jgi:hypothetical protein